MIRSHKATGIFVCGILLLALATTFLSAAFAQDVTPPVITDLTGGSPTVGENFTVKVRVTDDIALYRVQFYVYFIYFQGSSPIQNIMLYAANFPPGTTEFETVVETPLNATELKYQVTAIDAANPTNMAVTDVITRSVTDNILPIAECNQNITPAMGIIHTFNGSASTDNVGIANYTWAFQYGGAPVYLYGPMPAFNFTVAGQYSGTLAVRDFQGNTDYASFQVSVGDSERPKAYAGVQMLTTAGDPIVFDGSGSSDNVAVTNYTWAFVHNETQVILYGVSPGFVFWNPGVYDVSLTVRDAAGNSDTVLLPVQVLEASGEGGGFLPWWAYVLAAMIFIFMVLGILILRD